LNISTSIYTANVCVNARNFGGETELRVFTRGFSNMRTVERD